MSNPIKDLDVWDSLFVRACKCSNPTIRRFKKIWSMRCDLQMQYCHERDIIEHLIDLIQMYRLVTMSQFISRVYQNEHWDHAFGKPAKTIDGYFLETITSIIRLTEVQKLPGLRSPTRFTRKRNQSEKEGK